MMGAARHKALRLSRRMRGMTLVELLIVVVIVGILAAIAYPNYREFTLKARRTEARALLLEIATMQERHYLQNNTYGSLADLGYANPQPSDSGYYLVTVPSADANNFRAVATYQPDDSEAGKCKTFEIDGRGAKISDPYTDCWSRTR